MSYDGDVVNATSGVGEANWDQIIKLCNRIRDSVGPTSMSQAMASVLKRVRHSDPKVQLHALTLLEACVSNCGQDFQLELTKQPFQTDIKNIVTGSYSDPRVTQRVKELLVNWGNEFKSSSSMAGLSRFIEQLRKDGISFPGLQQPPASTSGARGTAVSTTTTPIASREEEDLRKAIQMSLKESAPPTSSLYPAMPTGGHAPSPSSSSAQPKNAKKVRAIYDFSAAEDNELTFRAGEIITLLDSSDENWWRGETQLGSGLFPASFVSANLSQDPEPSKREKKDKKSKKSKARGAGGSPQGGGGVVNEQQIDLLLEMLKSADTTSEENHAENQTLHELEEQCKAMHPVMEKNAAALQKQEDVMQGINQQLQDALATYRKLLAEGPRLSSTAVQPPSLASQAPPPSQPPPPSLTSHPPHAPPYHTNTYTQPLQGAPLAATSVYSAVPGTQYSTPPVLQQSPYQLPSQPSLQQPVQLFTGASPSPAVSMATQPPPYQAQLYQPQQQNTLLGQPLY